MGNLAIQYAYARPEKVRGNKRAQMTEPERESVAFSLEETSNPPATVPRPSTPQNPRLPPYRGGIGDLSLLAMGQTRKPNREYLVPEENYLLVNHIKDSMEEDFSRRDIERYRILKLATGVMDKYKAYNRDWVISDSKFESCIKTPMLKIGRAGFQIRKIECKI